jgi:hypothetical protein
MRRRLPAAVLLLTACCLPAFSAQGNGDGPSRVELTERGGLRVNGRPFVPIFAWAVPRKHVGFNKRLGLNSISPASNQLSKELLDELHANGIMCLLDADDYSEAIAAHPALLAWRFGDEPDMRGLKAPDLAERHKRMRRLDPAHPTLVNLTSRFYKTYYRGDEEGTKWPNREQYRAYADVCEIVSYDHYPVTGYNKPDRVPELYHATADLVGLIPAKSHWTIVESADQDLKWTPPETRGPTPAETRAMVWMAIVGGAKGIGYFHLAFNPFRWENLTPEMEAELPKINGLITELAGPIAEGEILAHAVDREDVKARAVRHDGGTFVFSVNLGRERRSAAITLRGADLRGRAEVVGEGRDIALDGGVIADDFAPLAVHVYRIAAKR